MVLKTVHKGSNLTAELIHLKYSHDNELSLLNKGLLDNSDIEYLNYREYVNEVKSFV